MKEIEYKPIVGDLSIVDPLVDDSGHKMIYVWKTGTKMFLSKREWIAAETYVKTGSFNRCIKALKEEGFEYTVQAVKVWLEREHVKEWVSEKLEEGGVAEGWSKDHWMSVMQRHLDGKERLKSGDLYALKLIADVKGFKEPDVTNNLSVLNFTQSNGQV